MTRSLVDRQSAVLHVTTIALAAAVLCGLWIGPIAISPTVIFDAVEPGEALHRSILLELRAPRTLTAALVGAALAVSGAALQGLFRNPLADPGLIGVASGAAVGAIASIVAGDALDVPAVASPYATMLFAFAGGILATTFVYAFAASPGRVRVADMLLVGIAINAIATVIIGSFQYLSTDDTLRTLTYWLLGSFAGSTWDTTVAAMIPICLGALLLVRQARNLDLLQLGEADARRLGVDVDRTRRRVVLGSAACVAAGVAVAGIVAFVGLVVPHLTRLLGGASHRYVVPVSAILAPDLP